MPAFFRKCPSVRKFSTWSNKFWGKTSPHVSAWQTSCKCSPPALPPAPQTLGVQYNWIVAPFFLSSRTQPVASMVALPSTNLCTKWTCLSNGNAHLAKASLSDDHGDRKGVPLCQQNLPFSEMKWNVVPGEGAAKLLQLRSCAAVHCTIGCNILPLWQCQICSLYHIFTIVYDG